MERTPTNNRIADLGASREPRVVCTPKRPSARIGERLARGANGAALLATAFVTSGELAAEPAADFAELSIR